MKKKIKKSTGLRKKLTIGAVAIATGALAIRVGGGSINVPLYRMERVVDGDTFVTTDNQMIRIVGIDAPELGMCGGDEATASLTKILKQSPLYMKIVYRDNHNRLYGLVYNINGSVAKQQLFNGMAVMSNNADTKADNLAEALNEARRLKKGIYGSKCTQEVNPDNPNCVIKGNNRQDRAESSKPTYHFPGCGTYNVTQVQLYQGDQWFCTEKAAKAAGYEKGADCFEKSWK